ncbi:putative ureide permease [Helianthus annuus]|nr:putative ureide permease [Helianthus annuus]
MFHIDGTTLNYFLDDKINRAEILFPGVACFLIAVCLGSFVHASNAKDNKTKLERLGAGEKGVISNGSNPIPKKDLENGSVKVEKAKVGTASFLIELESRRAIKVLLDTTEERKFTRGCVLWFTVRTVRFFGCQL